MLSRQLRFSPHETLSLPHTLHAQHARLTGMRTNRLWTSNETTDASNMGAKEYPKTHCGSARWLSYATQLTRLWKNDLRISIR